MYSKFSGYLFDKDIFFLGGGVGGGGLLWKQHVLRGQHIRLNPGATDLCPAPTTSWFQIPGYACK